MKFYLASRYGRRLELRAYAERLRAIGHEVTSRWLGGEHEAFDASPTREQMMDWSEDDIADIRDADVFVAFTEHPDSPFGRGGRHVEAGHAMALGKEICVVGPVENIFYVWARYRASDFELFFEDANRPNFLGEF